MLLTVNGDCAGVGTGVHVGGEPDAANSDVLPLASVTVAVIVCPFRPLPIAIDAPGATGTIQLDGNAPDGSVLFEKTAVKFWPDVPLRVTVIVPRNVYAGPSGVGSWGGDVTDEGESAKKSTM